MAYIGKTPTVGNFQVCDAISVVNGQAAYTMQVGSVNVSPESANHMLVSLNGILQRSGSSFTVSGSTITFASNLVTGDVIDFIQILGNVLDLGVPSDSTVSLAKLTATGTKSSSTFLRGDNTFATPTAGLNLIKTVTASGASSVEFINGTSDVVFDSTYKQYILKAINFTASTNANSYLRFRIGGSFATSNYYRTLFIQRTSAAVTQSSTATDNSNGIYTSYNYVGQTPSAHEGEFIINNPSSTSIYKSVYFNIWGANQEGTQKVMQNHGSAYYSSDSSSAATGVGLFLNTGTISGTFSLYGVTT